MSFLNNLSPESLEGLADLIGNRILSTISVINTLYESGEESFSGTGLIVSDGAKKYLLTANHVLEPAARTFPKSSRVVRHYHSFALEKEGAGRRPYALRGQYWKSRNHDLALIESSISERLDVDPRTDYFPVANLLQPLSFDPSVDDLFVVCGFPERKRLHLPFVPETKHGMLIHFFHGRHGRQDPDRASRYRIRYDDEFVRPAGMSGSPVWLVRSQEKGNSPLSVDILQELSGQRCTLALQFLGVVVEHFETDREISAVKTEFCAKFAEQALPVLPTLRTPEEDVWIEEQLANF